MANETPDVTMVMNSIKAAFDRGDSPPGIEFSEPGRIRLTNALQKKFGLNFRNNPRALAAIQAFDSEMNFTRQILSLRGN